MTIRKSGEYYGEMQSESSLPEIHISRYRYHDKRTDWHFHEQPYLMYIIQGNLSDVTKNSKRQCPTGSLIFYNWQEAHYNIKETELAQGFHVEFSREWFNTKKLDVDLWDGSRILEDPTVHHIVLKIYYEFAWKDAYSSASIELLMMSLCEHLNNTEFSQKNEPPWVGKLKDLILSGATDLNLRTLSETLNVHPAHILRAVPKYFGSSLGDYIRKIKVKHALQLLYQPEYALTQIAYTCGFSDQSHFTRTFKSYLGVTPSAFRKQTL